MTLTQRMHGTIMLPWDNFHFKDFHEQYFVDIFIARFFLGGIYQVNPNSNHGLKY